MLHILKIPTIFGVALQNFCENQKYVQDQYQDQDHNFTLNFNIRPTFFTQQTPTKFCSDPLTPSKVIVSTSKVHVRTDRQTDRRKYRQIARQTGRQASRPTSRETDRQTERRTEFFCLFCVLIHTKHKHSSKGENFFPLMRLQYSLFLYTPYIMRK